MPFVTIKSNAPKDFPLAKMQAIEVACKEAWVRAGSGFSGKFLASDVGGVAAIVSHPKVTSTILEFYYVDRGPIFEKKLYEELLATLLHASNGGVLALIILCPTASELWFADPTWAVRVKHEGLGPQIR